jgi:hypothetical protein
MQTIHVPDLYLSDATLVAKERIHGRRGTIRDSYNAPFAANVPPNAVLLTSAVTSIGWDPSSPVEWRPETAQSRCRAGPAQQRLSARLATGREKGTIYGSLLRGVRSAGGSKSQS